MKYLPKLAIAALFGIPTILIVAWVHSLILQILLVLAVFYGIDYALRRSPIGERLGYVKQHQ